MDTTGEIWQVDIDGTLYEADSDTLKQWVLDGYVTPHTKVQKGSLKWIEAQRVPALRSLFATGSAFPEPPPPAPPPAPDWPAPDVPSYGGPSAAAAGYAPDPGAYGQHSYGQPSAPAAYGMCVNHVDMRAKFVCQGCGASLCMACTKRYGNAAVCVACGELCRPFGEAQTKMSKQAARYSPFGLNDFANDFAAAILFPTKDLLGVAIASVIFGILIALGSAPMYGGFARAVAAALLFGYMTGAIRLVSMGKIEEGPIPDLSDPGDLIFTAARLGIAVTLITFGPLLVVTTSGLFAVAHAEEVSGGLLATVGIWQLLAGLWALFYYPMALLVAGYTQSFLDTLNPLLGLTTMKRMGSVYVKAYVMYAVTMGAQFTLVLMLAAAEAVVPHLGLGTLPEAVIYFGGYVLQGVVYFFCSMIVAAVLGLAVYKRADELEVYVVD
jgi:hypothetical protein